MKKMFENPEVELEKFQVEDVLTNSTGNGNLGVDDGEAGDYGEDL